MKTRRLKKNSKEHSQMIHKSIKFYIIISLIIGPSIITGCTLIHKATYAPDFTYLEKSTVTSSIQQMVQSTDKIDRILNEPDSRSVSQVRNIIIKELNKMERIADNLCAGTITTNHLFIDQHIDQFKSDVIQVRRFIEVEPSNYYLAGKLVGSCISCHILRPEQQILMNLN